MERSPLWKLNEAVLFGEAGGKILWQPRIGCWFTDKRFAGEALPPPFTGMDLPDIFRELGCSDRLYNHYNRCFKRVEDPRVRISTQTLNETDTKTIIETPAGKQTAVHRRTPNSPRQITLKWEAETEEELKVATWREEHTTWRWDPDAWDKAVREVGDLGAPAMYMPRMNVQNLYIERMGVERGVFAMVDWTDTTEAFFRAQEASHDRLINVINASPVRMVNFGENVHSGTLSPDLFLKYHLPACQRRCERLHAAGKFVSSHWDGDCGPLLKYAKETGLDGIEAITPEPQGDVTLDEIKAGLGDDLFLLDGLPAVYFDSTFSEKTLTDCARRLIDLFAPRLVLGISDELSSRGEIERVRVVGRIVDEYNAAR